MPTPTDKTARMVQAGILSWVVPGLGHWVLGHRGLAIVFFLAISFPFWTGALVGGAKYSINPGENPWLFLAELGAGGYSAIGLLISGTIQVTTQNIAQIKAFYPESDVAQIYLSTAGLLNLMVILDALTRAQTGGLPTYHRELARTETPPARSGAA